MIKTNPLLPSLQNTTNNLVKRFSVIPHERKQLLQQLSAFVQSRVQNRQVAHLNFICTHNSRRSHLSQLWAQAAAYYYGVPNVQAYSGGTEATAFNPRAVKAMMDAGFNIVKLKDGDNPVYEVSFAEEINPVRAFSKKYDDPFNHNKDFAAIMTCSHADENCPLVAGAAARIALTYDDPKEFDGTPLEQEKYKERVEQIGTEILYAFSLISKQ
ncbi:MAG TPA: protein-tyrosine-phosphatase [Cyclobacteriaceae bacterium]|nr:protein-tyrosine-phosphatase [Cyclobacteriaceae bacterium]HMV91079.1 protein-tyrosine-phosphatase [Cyclobacteriaceae bacterium]HMX01321.1 protein-tyrosine-phosphatase [Cyclobacteriaceae bacterium]HMX51265.1 protein-tyrosine-phosphatase [Cyclobacteriaceae bacterium]HMY92123.1 protein-tyrosine-phosphatase [Cyclobacteriaceae bacterium]